MNPTLILFDIDGTLLNLHGAGRRAYGAALQDIFGGLDGLEHVSFAGSTDMSVLQQIMARRARRPTPEEIRRFIARMPGELEKEIARGGDFTLYPGVTRLLDELSARHHVRLGLVTGNVESCARLKLRHFDLLKYFAVGGFGDAHSDRADIARLARQRAQSAGSAAISRIFLVGDSPSDITAAHAIDAASVAVATGAFDLDTLRRAGAMHALADLSDTEKCLAIFESP